LTGRETVLDLAGVTPITTDGLSLSSVLAGGRLRRSGILLEHKGNPTTKDTVPSYCGFRSNRYMFIHYADDGTGVQEEELYNLHKDPFELTNIAATLPAQAQPQLRDAAYAAGCDPTIVPPADGLTHGGAGLRPAPP